MWHETALSVTTAIGALTRYAVYYEPGNSHIDLE